MHLQRSVATIRVSRDSVSRDSVSRDRVFRFTETHARRAEEVKRRVATRIDEFYSVCNNGPRSLSYVMSPTCTLRVVRDERVTSERGLSEISTFFDGFCHKMAACILCDRCPDVKVNRRLTQAIAHVHWQCIDFADAAVIGKDVFLLSMDSGDIVAMTRRIAKPIATATKKGKAGESDQSVDSSFFL